MTQTERLILRARDAVANRLVRHLTVPTICFEAPWPGPDDHVDILAVDRAGTGDVHVVAIKGGSFDMKRTVERLMRVPAQFRWLAALKRAFAPWASSSKAPAFLYPRGEMGRIGLIEIVKTEDDGLGANIRFRAERFRGNLSKEADAFLATHKPDIEFR